MDGADSMFIYEFMILWTKWRFTTTDKLRYNSLLIHGLGSDYKFYNSIYLSETIMAKIY